MTQEFVMLPREVAEQALEALINEGEFRKLMKPLIEKSIDSIRAALEQPQAVTDCHQSEQPRGEQEPASVAKIIGMDEFGPMLLWHRAWTDFPVGTKLYTYQQPKREPLTDMQKMMCWSRATHDADVWHKTEHQCLMDYGAEIEAAHNIK